MRNINIKAVVKMTGINENTLRAWERRYNIVEPDRTEDGHRMYGKKDIEKIALLWRLVQQGHQISRLANVSMVNLRKLEVESFGVQVNSSAPEVKAETPHLDSIIKALKDFDLEALQVSLNRAKFELSPRTIILHLILPLLNQVGVEVMAGRLSIAQEHLLSSLLRDHLGAWYQALAPYEYRSQFSSERILVTTREGDIHEFAVLLAAMLCRLHGYQTYYLGSNMPAKDLVIACEQFRITSVILGLAALPPAKEFIKAADYVKILDKSLPKKVDLFFGGSADISVDVVKSERRAAQFSTMQELDEFLGQLNR